MSNLNWSSIRENDKNREMHLECRIVAEKPRLSSGTCSALDDDDEM